MVYLFYLAILVSEGVRAGINILNMSHAKSAPLPAEFSALLGPEEFQKSQAYLRDQTFFSLTKDFLANLFLLAAIALGFFGVLDSFVAYFSANPVVNSLLFFLALGIFSEIFSLPYSYVHTFVLEEKYGFNRSTLGTFFSDHLKGWVLGLLLGGPLLWALFWFFQNSGELAWLWAWMAVAGFQIVLLFLAPALLMPLFFKFEPLPNGELRSAIEAYAQKENFQLKGVFSMDGSKRSSKANAFFTGFGPFRRIVLFDTLIEKHSVPELLAVLAHEVGHFKLGHIKKQMLLSFVVSFLLFFLLGKVLHSERAAIALGFSEWKVHAGLLGAFLLYSPFSLILGAFTSAISRRFEFEADAFAVRTTGSAHPLIDALKKLSKENLSNLSPHPWKVKLEYSHPPLVERLRALKALL